jgi:enoyl-CoA hydratase/carnithine racemase
VKIEREGAVLRVVLSGTPPEWDALQSDARVVLIEGSVTGANSDPRFFEPGLGLGRPLVVALQGVVLGAGLALLAAAHVAIAAQGSSFGFTDIREGRWNADLFRTLARTMGERRARELGLTGRIFTAPEALSYGLVHQIAPAFELEDRAWAVARALSEADEGAVRAGLNT